MGALPSGELEMIKITDKTFRYTPAIHTDLKKTFRRMALEKRTADARTIAEEAALAGTVVAIAKRRVSTKP